MKPVSSVLMLAIALGACGRSEEPPKPAETIAPAGPLPVEVVPVRSEMLSTLVTLPGQFQPFESVDLYAKVTGFIEAITVDRGSRVRRGQVLVRLSAPEVAAQQAQAAGELRAASAKAASDRATYGRLASAARTPGVVAENDVDVARQLAAVGAAQAQSAAAAVRAARETAEYLTIRAPFDGVVTARNLHPGAIVGPSAGSAPILQVAKAQRLRLVVAVPASDVQNARPGQALTFTTPATPGKTYSATISRMADSVDTASRTMMVEVDVPSGDGLTAGSFASVSWPVNRSYPTLRVPPTAIANDQQRQFVIRVRNNVTQWVDVTTGRNAEGTVEVFGNLKPGDQVIQRGTDAIKDGTKVKARRAPPAPKP